MLFANRPNMSPQLKIALIRRLSHRGFAVPLALALGLIMILLATMTIFKSQEESLNASTQRVSSRALSAAQSGVAKYQELINNNRVIATYDACATWSSGDSCSDTSGTTWAQASNIPGISDSCPNTTGSAGIVQTATTKAWTNVSTDASLGQYRFVDYVYVDSVSPPIGRLTIEGRVNQSGATTSADTDPSTAIARLEVEIPIQPGLPTVGTAAVSIDPDLNGLDPVIWLASSSASDTGNLKVDGNILVTSSSCTSPSDPSSSNLQDSTTQAVIASPRTFPPAISDPSSSSTVNRISNADLNAAGELPRVSASDKATTVNSNSYYYYVIDNTPTDTTDATTNDNFNLSSNLTIREGTKVIIYVKGTSISLSNTEVNENNNNSSAYLEIYGSSATTDVNISGTVKLTGLIHAPAATVNITDSSSDIDIVGAVWVNDWEDTSGSTNVDVLPDNQYQYYYYSSLDDMRTAGTLIIPPTLSSPSSWTTEEVP